MRSQSHTATANFPMPGSPSTLCELAALILRINPPSETTTRPLRERERNGCEAKVLHSFVQLVPPSFVVKREPLSLMTTPCCWSSN